MSEPLPDIPGIARLAFLASGGFGDVYTGQRDGRDVVVKIAHRPDDPRLGREATALRRVGPPFAPELFDTGELPSRQPYLVMERIAGASLREHIGREGADLVALFADLCAAVDAVHAAGLIHRDLKPDNAMVRAGGGVALLDFGLADTTGDAAPLDDTDLTTTGQRLGTAAYMSPEQCLGEGSVDRRADVYALGVILFEMAVGRPPFEGNAADVQQSHVSRRPPLASSLAPVSRRLDEVLARALDKRPERRFDSASELAAAATRALRAGPDSAPSGESTAPGKRRRTAALLAVQTSRPVSWLESIAAIEGGRVAATSAGWYVLAFTESPTLREGVRSALRTSSALGAEADRCVVHAGSVRVRRRRGSELVAGKVIDQVGEWAEGSGARLALTARAAEQVRGLVAPTADPDLFTLRDTGTGRGDTLRSARLRGRGALIDRTLAAAESALEPGAPGLFTLIGERGYGKTRVLGEVTARLRQRGHLVIATSGIDPEQGEGEVLGTLLRFAFDLPERPTRTQVVDAIRARLPGAPPPLLPAAINALGVAPPSGLDATAYASPAASRQTLAGGLGEALRQRAGRAPFAVVVDDAHWVDPISLDALELATMSGYQTPVWVLVAAQPQLEVLRPTWGSRAAAAQTHRLEALSPEAATELLVELLYPAEYVPGSAITELLAMTERVPLHLVELARSLHAEGVIRQLEGTESHYLAVEELQHMRGTALGAQIAERAWRSIPEELHRVLSLCAVLGDRFDAAELEAVDRLCDPAGEVDPAAALERIVRAGLLLPGGGGSYRFRHPTVREALFALVPARERTALHDAARRYLEPIADSYALKLRLARHLRACGETEAAAATFVDLGDAAAANHRTMEAEQHYTSAIDLCGDRRDAVWLRAMSGRGKTRERLHQFAGALSDLRAARAYAEQAGDVLAAARLSLEEATTLDWSWDFPAAADAVERARSFVEHVDDPLLEARYQMTVGRTRFRADDPAGAVEAFEPAIAKARTLRDHQTLVDAMMLLAPALVYLDRIDECLACYEELLALCATAGDRMHEGAALSNRVLLWTQQLDYVRGVDDARRATQLAREVGNVGIERAAQGNLAELLLWLGELDEALSHALRSAELERRYLESSGRGSALLLARVLVARKELGEVAGLAEAVRGSRLAPVEQLLLRTVELSAAGGTDEQWRTLLADARQLTRIDEHLEIFYSCATAKRGERLADEVIDEALRGLPPKSPWVRRFEALRRD